MHRHFDKILSPRFEEYEEATRYPEPQLQQVKVLEPHLACRLGIPSGHHEDVVSHKQVSDPVLAHQMNRAQAETKRRYTQSGKSSIFVHRLFWASEE